MMKNNKIGFTLMEMIVAVVMVLAVGAFALVGLDRINNTARRDRQTVESVATQGTTAIRVAKKELGVGGGGIMNNPNECPTSEPSAIFNICNNNNDPLYGRCCSLP